jgi:hypothetical protein
LIVAAPRYITSRFWVAKIASLLHELTPLLERIAAPASPVDHVLACCALVLALSSLLAEVPRGPESTEIAQAYASVIISNALRWAKLTRPC